MLLLRASHAPRAAHTTSTPHPHHHCSPPRLPSVFPPPLQDVRIFGANSTTANFVSSASRDGHCRVHDLRKPVLPVMTSRCAEPRGFTAIDFSPDGRWLYAAAASKEWQVVDAYTGHTVLRVGGHTDAVSCLRATPDGRSVCTGSDDQTVCIWNVDRPHYW